MMIPSRNLTIIRATKTVLLWGIVLLALSQLYFAGLRTIDNLEKLNTWTRQSAEIASLGFDNEVEVITSSGFAETVPNQPAPKYCVARDEGTACLLLLSDPYTWLSVFDQVDILQNPQQPDQLAIVSVSGFWLPIAGNGLVLLLLAGVWYWLTRYSRWGEDITWQNGHWISTALSPQRIGLGSMDAEPITETASSRKSVLFWLVLIGLMASTLIPSLQAEATSDVATMVYLIAALGMVLLVLYTFAKTTSRTIYQDQVGLVDSSVLAIKRIPWQAIADVKRVNLSETAQRSYDRHHTFSEERPETLTIYQVVDPRGKTIIRLSEAMSPSHAFHALLSRLRRQQSQTTGSSESIEQQSAPVMADGFAEPLGNDTDFEAQAMRLMGLSMPKRKSLFHRDHRSTLIGLALMLSPFVLLTGYLAYKSIWFQYVAEHTEGKVIEIKQDGVPSLVVKYRTPQGTSFTTHSDGSTAYDGFHVGDTLTVFYDAEDPENARLDLFLELWLWTILMGGLTSIVLLGAILIGRGLTTPMPMSMK